MAKLDDDIRKIDDKIEELREQKKKKLKQKESERNNYLIAFGLFAEQKIKHDQKQAKIFFHDYEKHPGISGNENLAKRIKSGLEKLGISQLEETGEATKKPKVKKVANPAVAPAADPTAGLTDPDDPADTGSPSVDPDDPADTGSPPIDPGDWGKARQQKIKDTDASQI